MNTIDLVLGLILIAGFFLGFRKGLFRVLASFIGLIAGVYCAIYFSGYAMDYLIRWFDWTPEITKLVAFFLTFFIVALLFSLLGRILTKAASLVMFGFFNKLFGGILSVLQSAFFLSIIFMVVNSSESYRILSPEKREQSKLYEPIASIAPAILPAIEKKLDELDIDPERDFPLLTPKDSLQ